MRYLTATPKVATLLLASSQVVASATNFTSLVNLFIGTASGANGGSGGNAFPGAAVPHAMVKVGIDVDTAPRQAGYISDNSSITGISLMHDEGTGGNTNGGYGIFPLFPLINCDFTSCPVGIDARKTKRAAKTDAATPGYFTTTFVNGIKLEATSTRRAGLIRFTYPQAATSRHVVVDLTHDLGRSFEGGTVALDRSSGQVQLTGTFLQSYGTDNYTVHACYDFNSPISQNQQSIVSTGTFQSSKTSAATITITPANTSSLSFPFSSSATATQAGALLSFNSSTVLVRFGVSFLSSAQACANAEEEVPDWDWEKVMGDSVAKWEDVLSRVSVDVTKEDPTVVELLYSSLYRAHLVPANLTNENPYWDSPYPFFDAFFCSWDTFRTVHPLLSITSPREWSQIVNAYIDGWRHQGFIPECRANTKAGYVQGGSDGMPILGDFVQKYASHAQELNVPTDDLYQALVDTATKTPPDWYRVGRQNTAWLEFGYIPTAWADPSGATGLPTREASRTLEYALGDFHVRQAALTLNKSTEDVDTFGNRSMGFVKVWDPNVTSDGFTGFSQRRFANGTFAFSPPDACSPIDPTPHSCARGTDNNVGFYESSSWEYSFFAPHSMATLIKLMGGNATFISRLDHYFSKGYFLAGNEPSFAIPWAYHYANRPDLSVLRVRNVIFKNFNTGIGGASLPFLIIPGNDDSGAMAALLAFHMLGLYPTPFSWQLLVGSPLVSSYTITNNLLGTKTTVTVEGFDKSTLVATPPSGSKVFVKSITVNGVANPSVCWLAFDDLIGGGEIVIEVDGDASAAAQRGCGGSDPTSLNTGGNRTGTQSLPDSL
ncbi:glycosyl hydrolase family 92-domain-containing protein [Cristinia sonorae]|uniref:Glycosyl hydrolase family 92-domain-containing protein n=1 Tax=Cristinia sonorae TaxID=1940300 RepID=A0A8K0UHT5_9AGAR|nr:glycosyl hydrolase family 92-domain-containing protein [Cristinia sonorae]